MSTLQDVITEWQNNLQFRKDFKKNPHHALTEANLVLSAEDLEKVKVILSSDNGTLDDRINK